jgi:hypothetical protein
MLMRGKAGFLGRDCQESLGNRAIRRMRRPQCSAIPVLKPQRVAPKAMAKRTPTREIRAMRMPGIL